MIVRDEIGFIRDITSGEVMHPTHDPVDEARSLYVEQSKLLDRLQEPVPQPLVVWDVGLGAAANAMSAILTLEAQTRLPARQLKLVSFENDLDSLRLALDHMAWFKYLRHAAPRAIVSAGRWVSDTPAIEWCLLSGDFTARKQDAPAPDIIFFDPFSFKTDSSLWTLRAFRELMDLCGKNAVALFTYTYSTSVRAAMLAAGFFVAKGRGTGPKLETTVGLTPQAASGAHGCELLGAEWLGWRQRSGCSSTLLPAVTRKMSRGGMP